MTTLLPAIDVHAHVYPEQFVSLLRSRDAVPPIVTRGRQDRMLILPGEDADSSTSVGRPIGSEYWDGARKVAFMTGMESPCPWPARPIPGWMSRVPAASSGFQLK